MRSRVDHISVFSSRRQVDGYLTQSMSTPGSRKKNISLPRPHCLRRANKPEPYGTGYACPYLGRQRPGTCRRRRAAHHKNT